MKTRLSGFFKKVKDSQGIKLNKQFSVFSACFFIAVIFWFLISLSKNYNSSISFPIVYAGMPEGKVVVNELPKTVAIEINARGFDLMGYHLKLLTVPIVIRIKANATESSADGYIATKSLISTITKQLNTDVRVIAIEPDTIFLKFSPRATKQVVVRPAARFYFEKQYNLAGKVRVEPNRVWITGPKEKVDSINYLITDLLVLKNIKDSISQVIRLNTRTLDKNIHVVSHNVTLKAPVEKFTEETIELPVAVRNKKSSYRIKTFPDKVKVSYLVSLSKYNKVTPGAFVAEVDMGDPDALKSSKARVDLVQHPDFIKVLKIVPSKVDYIKLR